MDTQYILCVYVYIYICLGRLCCEKLSSCINLHGDNHGCTVPD